MLNNGEEVKRIKDPIYGYIDIPSRLFKSCIDKSGFQRLRRIVQTSFEPVYPSALHNRFVHSIGVYHLGDLAAKALDSSFQTRDYDVAVKQYWEKALCTFRMACLLHDYGHAPFSHAGEGLYRQAPGDIDEELRMLIRDELFERDSTQPMNAAAPHEVMSTLLSLHSFPDIIELPVLFARCITGYRHQDPEEITDYLDNILIDLLNSSAIDVDKLDYLIRDSRTMGFESIEIDYVRLLQSVRIAGSKNKPVLAFYKSALSVLENAVYARDLEKKWVQSHPVTLYEQLLVQHMAGKVCAGGDKGPYLFCEQALTDVGVCIGGGLHVRLFADDDVVFLAKQLVADDCDNMIEEYFAREKRRHPVWKSEPEFKALFVLSSDYQSCRAIDTLKEEMAAIIALLKEKGKDPVLSKDTISLFESELEDIEAVGDDFAARRKRRLKRQMQFLLKLENFCERSGIEFNFVLLDQKGFMSGFGSSNIDKINIIFNDGATESYYEFGAVSAVLHADDEAEEMFYLFHHRANDKGFPKEGLIGCLKEAFID